MNRFRLLPLVLLGLACLDSAAGQAVRPSASEIVRLYGMSKIPHEGPWFLQTYKSPDAIEGALAGRYSSRHVAYTAIVNLSTRKDFSALHRLTTDEMWHFYLGDPLELLLLYPDGRGETVVLGPDVMAGQRVQYLVPRGVWQGSRPLGGDDAWSFLGNTMAPGFEYDDYEPGYREELQKGWPNFSEKIAELTREDSLKRPKNEPPKPEVSAMELTELAGRNAPVKSEHLSVAHFRLLNQTKPEIMKNLSSEEMIIVLSGTCELQIADSKQIATANQVLRVPAGVSYSIASVGAQPLEAYAICAPAFTPEQHRTGE